MIGRWTTLQSCSKSFKVLGRCIVQKDSLVWEANKSEKFSMKSCFSLGVGWRSIFPLKGSVLLQLLGS